MHIANFNNYGTPNLPPNLDLQDPLAIFRLLFTNKIIEKLPEWINKYAELYPLEEEARFARKWKYSTLRTTFDRVNNLSEHLQLSCRKLHTPRTHLAADETIQRFMRRTPEIVNIPSKPTPEGFKIWVLANEGYVLDWLWHAKGDKKGPVDPDTTFTKEEGFSKTQAVILDLLLSATRIQMSLSTLPGVTLFGLIT